jgi:chromosome segregation ATPase
LEDLEQNLANTMNSVQASQSWRHQVYKLIPELANLSPNNNNKENYNPNHNTPNNTLTQAKHEIIMDNANTVINKAKSSLIPSQAALSDIEQRDLVILNLLKEKDITILRLQQHISQLQQQNKFSPINDSQELHAKLAELTHTNACLHNELVILTQTQQNSSKTKESQHFALEYESSQLKAAYQQCLAEKELQHKAVEDLSIKRKELEDKFSTATQEIAQLKQQLANFYSNYINNTEEIKPNNDAEIELANMKEKLAQLHGKVEQQVKRGTHQAELIQTLQAQLQENHSQLAQKNNEINALYQRINNSNGSSSSSSSSSSNNLSTVNKELLQLRAELGDKNKEITALQQKLHEISNSYIETVQENGKMASGNSKEEFQLKNTEIKQLQKVILSQKSKIAELVQFNNFLTTNNSVINHANTENDDNFRRELFLLQGELTSKANLIAELYEKIMKFTEDSEKTKKIIEELQETPQFMANQQEELRGSYKLLQNQVNSLQTCLAAAQEEVALSKEENSQLQEFLQRQNVQQSSQQQEFERFKKNKQLELARVQLQQPAAKLTLELFEQIQYLNSSIACFHSIFLNLQQNQHGNLSDSMQPLLLDERINNPKLLGSAESTKNNNFRVVNLEELVGQKSVEDLHIAQSSLEYEKLVELFSSWCGQLDLARRVMVQHYASNLSDQCIMQ